MWPQATCLPNPFEVTTSGKPVNINIIKQPQRHFQIRAAESKYCNNTDDDMVLSAFLKIFLESRNQSTRH